MSVLTGDATIAPRPEVQRTKRVASEYEMRTMIQIMNNVGTDIVLSELRTAAINRVSVGVTGKV